MLEGFNFFDFSDASKSFYSNVQDPISSLRIRPLNSKCSRDDGKIDRNFPKALKTVHKSMLPSLVFAWTCIRACAELQPTCGTERERASELASHSYYVTPMTSSIQILQHLRVRGCWYRVALDGDDVTTQHRIARTPSSRPKYMSRCLLSTPSTFLFETLGVCVCVWSSHHRCRRHRRRRRRLRRRRRSILFSLALLRLMLLSISFVCHTRTHARTHTSTIRSSIVQLLCNVASRYTGL